ncbi:MAG: hypothetical protein E6R04_09670 [Spirochaetes bacterium]|nr:MAG: hypothetical protein E6R04_09670 [Spirochaetota bacterium]
MAGNSANIRVEPSIVTFGADVAQVQTIKTIADSSGSLNSTYFFLYAADGTKRYVWLNINSAGVDPAPAGFTGVSVAAATSASAATIASALQSAIDGLDDFTASVSGNTVTVTDVTQGYAPEMHDSNAAPTGFAFSTTTLGDNDEELGCLEGEIEISFSQSTVPVSCHESGVTPVVEFVNGLEEVTVTLTMLETTFAKLKKVLAKTQGSMIPVGSAGTEVIGIGQYRDFKNLMTFATRLNIHPKRLLAADMSLDITAWKAIPILEGLTLSGEAPVTLPLTFKCFPDSSKSTRANILCIGDYSQSVVGG